MSKQDDINQEQGKWRCLARLGLPAVFRKEIVNSVPYNKSFIERVHD